MNDHPRNTYAQPHQPRADARASRPERQLEIYQTHSMPANVLPPVEHRSEPGWPMYEEGVHSHQTPFLLMDLATVQRLYEDTKRLFPSADVFYAVKANPAPEIVQLLSTLGSNFDAASPAEIDTCLAAGVSAERISYGNTIKKAKDIAYAYARGVRLFAFDSGEELEKLSANAPGARVFCRLLVSSAGAQWPLSRKFGCELAMAEDLLLRCSRLGIRACGVSLHVGSQQTDPHAWRMPLGHVATLFARLRAAGLDLDLVNLGGGFPAKYLGANPILAQFAEAIHAALREHFGSEGPKVMLEPGRSLVADAGVIVSEVVLVSRKRADDPVRWVYLDVGRFGGLAETQDESIRYRISTSHDGGPRGPVVLAGPTCDSADILYERSAYELPLALRAGDLVEIQSAGAYTLSYASVGFNGFAPLRAHFR